HAVTADARGDKVAESVRPAMRQRVDMVESGVAEIERLRAVHAAPTAVAHGGALNRVLVLGCRETAWTRLMGGVAGTQDSVIVPSGQFHIAKKTTPRDGRDSHHGALCPSRSDGGDS